MEKELAKIARELAILNNNISRLIVAVENKNKVKPVEQYESIIIGSEGSLKESEK